MVFRISKIKARNCGLFFIFEQKNIMKKTILLLLAVSTLTAMAHEPKFSMFKKQESKINKEHTYSSGRSAGSWFLISGASLFVGSISKVVATYDAVPDITSYTTIEDYNKGVDKYNRHQRTFNTVFYTGVGVAGIAIVFGAFDLLNTPIAENSKTTLKIKSNGSNIGLCLNFK